MRSRLFTPKHEYAQDEWAPWFAIWPVRAKDGPDQFRWVWLEWVEYKYDPDSYDYAGYLYQIRSK